MTKKSLTTSALMMCIILLMTFLVRIPVPATQGYIHLGDGMIFLGVMLLGWKRGAIVAGIGSALADLLGGFAMFAPISLVLKAAMAVIAGLIIQATISRAKENRGKWMVAGMLVGGIVMIAGYYGAESVIYGSYLIPLIEIPMNLLQLAVGIVIACLLAAALGKAASKLQFFYKWKD